MNAVWRWLFVTGSILTCALCRAGSMAPAGVMISGIVKTDDGLPLLESVSIRVACGGVERTVAHTTPAADFAFQWNANPASAPLSAASVAYLTPGNSDASTAIRELARDDSGYCELRAELAGFTSTVVNLNNSAAFDGSDVGVIWLHRVSRRQSNIVSVTTLSAPKEATRNFDKGIESIRANKLEEAAESFGKAVAIYPRYAEAWLHLGGVQFKMGSSEAARLSLLKAVDLDAKLAGSWQILGYMAADKQQWADAVRYLDQAERLDPLSSPLPWFFSALADYRLRRFDDAERSIREEIRLDPQRQNYRATYLLGLILIAQHDPAGGADALRGYLASSHDPNDADTVRTILSRLQQFAAK